MEDNNSKNGKSADSAGGITEINELPKRHEGVIKKLWKIARDDENRVFQIVVAVACITANFLIGVFYQDKIFFKGWQVIIWAISLIFLFVELVPKRKIVLKPDRVWVAIGAILLVGFFLRVVGLGTFPPGFHIDEVGTADFTLRHIFPNPDETINPFITGNNSHPILYNYILRFFMDVFGYTIAGDRLSSAVAGTLAILATYFLVKEFSGRRSAIMAAIIMTSYNVHIHWSRIALNNIWTTLWIPLTIGFFIWGWRIKWSGGALLAGLALGMTAYFYSGGYVVVFLMIYLIWKLWRETNLQTGLAIYTGKMLAMALSTALPLLIFVLAKPDQFFLRANEINAWKPEAVKILMGDNVNYVSFFWTQFSGAFGVYNFIPEQSGFYLSNAPLILGAASILFLVGIGWAYYKKLFLPIIWILFVTILGGFLVAPPPSSSHYVAAIPAICWLIAIPIDRMFSTNRRVWAIALIVAIVVADLFFYFYIYHAMPGRDLIFPFPQVPNFTS